MSGAVLALFGVGGAPGIVNLPPDIIASPSSGAARFEIERDGDIIENGIPSSIWVVPKLVNIGDFYQVIFRDVTGNLELLSGPALNTWHDLSVDREWTLAEPGVGLAFVTGTIAIREKASGLERDSCIAEMRTGIP